MMDEKINQVWGILNSISDKHYRLMEITVDNEGKPIFSPELDRMIQELGMTINSISLQLQEIENYNGK